MAVTFYDNLSLNEDIVLDWPFLEGTGRRVHDQSKSGSIGELTTGGLPFIWPAETGQPFYGIYMFAVWEQYTNCPAAHWEICLLWSPTLKLFGLGDCIDRNGKWSCWTCRGSTPIWPRVSGFAKSARLVPSPWDAKLMAWV